jgi:hypothetical protein
VSDLGERRLELVAALWIVEASQHISEPVAEVCDHGSILGRI